MGIFTLLRGLSLSLPVAPIFSPHHNAKSITLQRDAKAHVFAEAHFFPSLGFGIKGIKLGHLENRSSGGALGGKEEDPLGGNTHRKIFLGGNKFWP